MEYRRHGIYRAKSYIRYLSIRIPMTYIHTYTGIGLYLYKVIAKVLT